MDRFWMLMIGLACYAPLGFTMLWLSWRSERRVQTLVEELRPRQPGRRRSGVILRFPRVNYCDNESLIDEALHE